MSLDIRPTKAVPIRVIRTSHSSRDTLHQCERKYQLYKLVGPIPVKKNTGYFSHGHAFEAGAAEYLLSGDKEKALYECWRNYDPEILDEGYSPYHSMLVLQAAFRRLDDLRADWEVAFFNGKPAYQLNVRLDIKTEGPIQFYEKAIIDLVLKNKLSGRYAVLEFKTTGSRLNDVNPMYENSGQAIGYSICLDAVAGEELTLFDTIYFVAQTKGKNMLDIEFHILPYRRTLHDRVKWFVTLGIDIERIETMLKYGHFPMRGQSCLHMNRKCEHFGFCQLTRDDYDRPEEPDDTVYDFTFNLDDIVRSHITRAQALPDMRDAELSSQPAVAVSIGDVAVNPGMPRVSLGSNASDQEPADIDAIA